MPDQIPPTVSGNTPDPTPSDGSRTVLSPDSLRYAADLCEALAAPRNASMWKAPDRIEIVRPGDQHIGYLVWDDQRQDYTLHVEGTP